MLWWVGIYVLVSLASVAVFVVLVLALPTTYFLKGRQAGMSDNPIVRWLLIVGKNLLGLAIVALGILLSLPGMPGQGIITILIGLTLLDFPGKHRFVRGVISRPQVLANVNRLRRLFRRPPLVAPVR